MFLIELPGMPSGIWVNFVDAGLLSLLSAPLLYVWVIKGVAQQKAEQVTRIVEETKKMLAATVEQAADTVVITNRAGAIEYVNSAFEQLSGYTREEVLGKTPRILKSGKHDQAFYENVWKIILSGKSLRMVFVNRKKNGELFFEDKTIASLRDRQGTITHFVSTGRDITERRKAEEALRESHYRFETVTRATKSVVWDWDLLTNGLWWDKTFQEVFLYRSDEIEAGIESWTNRIHPEDLERVVSGIHATIASGNTYWVDEYRFRCGDGRYIDIEDHGYIVHDKIGKAVRMIGAMVDVTQRKLVQEELRRAYAELIESHEALRAAQSKLIQSEKLEAIGRLAAGVAHEVKNPLGIILQSVNYLEKVSLGSGQQEQPEILGMMKEAVLRADKIIRELLHLSKPIELKLKSCAISQVIDTAVESVERQLNVTNVRVVKDIPLTLPPVIIDEDQMRQVFINLILNAFQAMPNGGQLTVAGSLKKAGESHDEFIDVAAVFRPGESVVVCEVADTGMGIPREIFSRAFEPFFTTKPPGEGVGLGLVMSKTIVEAHRGLLRMESEEGRGTTVTVVLPLTHSN